jgi:hypothetical protein
MKCLSLVSAIYVFVVLFPISSQQQQQQLAANEVITTPHISWDSFFFWAERILGKTAE